MRTLIALALFASLAQAAELTVTAVPTFTSCGYYVDYADNTGKTCKVYYRVSAGAWDSAYTPHFSSTDTEYRGSIVGLLEATAYDLKVEVYEGASKTDSGGTTFTTWTSSPTIDTTIEISDIYSSGGLLINGYHGAEDAWIKIVDTGDPDTIDGGLGSEYALRVYNSEYVIFEGLTIRGGHDACIQSLGEEGTGEAYHPHHIRFINCDISNWGEQHDHFDAYGQPVDAEDAVINNRQAFDLHDYDADVNQGPSYWVIERCFIHDPKGTSGCGDTSNFSENEYPKGNFGMAVRTHHTVVRYNDFIGTDDHLYVDVIGQWVYGFTNDCDIIGNLFTHNEDDVAELEGTGVNIRFGYNLSMYSYMGPSTRSIDDGPLYFYRNVMANRTGSRYGFCWPGVKAGGGSSGMEYYFHNTLLNNSSVLTNLGSEIRAQTRNNVFTSLSESYAIDDPDQSAWNDWDYDMTLGSLRLVAGSEAHGIASSTPTWTDSSANLFSLQSGSNGIDDGEVLMNFSDGYASTAPDLGAIEYGASSLIPYRPINVTANKYRVTGSSYTTVTITSTTLDSTMHYTIRKADSSAWLTVTPTSGMLASDDTEVFTVSSTDASQRGVFFIRFANGYSIPITVDHFIGDAPEAPPDPPVATEETNVSSSGFTANWQESEGATSYRLDVSESDEFASYVEGYEDKTVSGISSVVSSLTASTTYYYRLRAVNAEGTSGNSNTITAITSAEATRRYLLRKP